MKTSSASAKPEAPSLQTARGCAGTNLALPGFGSLMAKRRVGWPQAALTVISFVLTLTYGVRFILWFFQNTDRIYGADTDPLEMFLAVWLAVRWALLGVALFGMAWVWALTTNAAILSDARKAELMINQPPVLR